MKGKIRIYDICWHPGDELEVKDLPQEVICEDFEEEEIDKMLADDNAIKITDWLSEKYGHSIEYCYMQKVK